MKRKDLTRTFMVIFNWEKTLFSMFVQTYFSVGRFNLEVDPISAQYCDADPTLSLYCACREAGIALSRIYPSGHTNLRCKMTDGNTSG